MTVSNYILHLMASAIQRFSSPIDLSESVITKKDYYFDPEALSKGVELPKDKGCHKCGHIGMHFPALTPIFSYLFSLFSMNLLIETLLYIAFAR